MQTFRFYTSVYTNTMTEGTKESWVEDIWGSVRWELRSGTTLLVIKTLNRHNNGQWIEELLKKSGLFFGRHVCCNSDPFQKFRQHAWFSWYFSYQLRVRPIYMAVVSQKHTITCQPAYPYKHARPDDPKQQIKEDTNLSGGRWWTTQLKTSSAHSGQEPRWDHHLRSASCYGSSSGAWWCLWCCS
jgi:hypothetical protein